MPSKLRTEALLRALVAALDTYVDSGGEASNQARLIDTLDAGEQVGTEEFKALLQSLSAFPEVALEANRSYRFLKLHVPADASKLGWWLLRRASETTPETAIGDLDRFLKEDSFTFHAALVLADCRLDHSIDLAEGVQLVRFADLPSSPHKRLIAYEARARLDFAYQGQPTAVLVRYAEHAKASPQGGSPVDSLASPPPQDLFSSLYAAKYAVSMASLDAPHVLAQWLAPNPDVPLRIRHGHRSMNPGPRFPRVVDLNSTATETLEAHSAYSSLEPRDQDSVRIPMHYLDLALGSDSLVDALIYLSIALESLFLDDQSHGELGFRLRVRAARLLGEHRDAAVKIDELLRDFYNLRSQAVHTGYLGKGGKQLTSERAQNIGTDILIPVAKLASRGLMKRMHSPGGIDWQSVTLG